MKRVPRILTTASAIFIMGVSSLTLTGCGMEFKLPKEIENIGNTIEELGKTEDAMNELLQTVDEKDIRDEKELEDLLSNILDTGKEVGDTINAEFQCATLIRVVDGDTIVVEIDAEQYKVRLIGIDTPESVASQEYLDRTGKENTEAGKTASEYTKSVLADYNEVYLQKDTSDTDRYGRLLRYVWLEVPEDCNDVQELATKCLNGILIRNGYAELATYKPDTRYAKDLEYIYKMSHGETYEDGDYSEEYEIDGR